MAQPIENYSEDYEWVKVEAQQRFNISKRPWSNGKNIGLSEGEHYILPRGKVGDDGYAAGMRFFYENDGFFEVVDTDPEEVRKESEEVYPCDDCDREFDSKQGLRAHSSQKHKTNKKEETEE